MRDGGTRGCGVANCSTGPPMQGSLPVATERGKPLHRRGLPAVRGSFPPPVSPFPHPAWHFNCPLRSATNYGGYMKAQDIMAKNPRSVTPRTPIQEAARLMKSEDVGALPVVESEGSRRLVGMITDRDIAIRVVAEGRNVD